MASQPRIDALDALAALRGKLASGEPVSPSARTATPVKPHRPSAPRRPATPAVTLVSGTVTYFNEDKGFGFAYAVVNGVHQKVHFHVNNARMVTGTADSPELTREKHEQVYVTGNAGSNSTEIVMVVKPSQDPNKKATATSWGIRPKRNWRTDAIKLDKAYTDYVGGTVAIIANYGTKDIDVEEIRGTILEIKLTVDELTLVLTDAHLYDPTTHRTSESDLVAVCYKMEDAHLDGKNERRPESRSRRKVIIAPSMHPAPQRFNQVRIIMDKPARKAPEA